MPKRGGGKHKNFRSDNDSFEHDDRGHTHHVRRVIFKSGGNRGGKNKFNSWATNKLMDDDIDMGTSTNGERLNKLRGRGRGGRMNATAPHLLRGQRFIRGVLPWYQVTIPYGANYDKETILQALLSYISPEVFIPHYYKINGNAAVFYVDNVKTAEKLFYASRKITMPNGFKLMLLLKNYIPDTVIDDNLKETMKQVMAKRYNATTKALDLTKFHADPDLSEIFCALFRPMMMLAAIDIIAKNIPDIEAINFNDNKLHSLDHLKILSTKLPSLKILYLGDNKIPHFGSLTSLKSLPLVELFLTGNPLVSRCPDHESYVSEVRRRFPKLTRLDGEDLPPAIVFDVSEENKLLPPRLGSFLVDPQAQELVRVFLTQYYAIYDSESRQQLLEAYHENAIMSLSVNNRTSDYRDNSPANRLNSYLSFNRNLIRRIDREVRRKTLKSGKLQIVSALSELPKSKHDLMGFSVDVPVFTPTMIVLTVNGVFTETAVSEQPMRAFHRTFVIVPGNGGGYCIMNDIIFVTNTTSLQVKESFKSELPAAMETPSAPSAPSASSVAPVAVPNDMQKMQLLTLLQQATGMNQHWSLNCIQETGWDLQRAMFIFKQLQAEGKIPPEAFVK